LPQEKRETRSGRSGKGMAMATRPASGAAELIAKGRESAAVLQALLGHQPPAAREMPHGIRGLVEQILHCCDRALAALEEATEAAAESGNVMKRKLDRGPDAPRTRSSKRMRGSGGERGTRVEKKRTMEDGYIWRKYGQKEIRDRKYPRFYFRCSYYEDNGCKASRRVQQSDADPSVYLITYFGKHTCGRDNNNDEPPAPFVINFSSSSTARDRQPSRSPWPSCDDGAVVVTVSETSEICGLSEGKELPADTTRKVDALIEQSTPVPELAGMRSPEWEPLDGCLDWELGEDESSFDFGEFSKFDYFVLLQ
ncbi:EcWRKY-7, partial [Eragrostis curvula]